MFTGIITELGTVHKATTTDGGLRLVLDGAITTGTLTVGDSVAVAGACLTVIAVDGTRFEVEAVAETLGRTNLGSLEPGDQVNLERPLAATGRLDGHFVQGHVDGTVTVRTVTTEGDARRVWVDASPDLVGYVVEKGSVALDGVSLTVSAVDGAGFEVVLIPHTRQVTSLGAAGAGVRLNLEVDILAKYVARLLEVRR